MPLQIRRGTELQRTQMTVPLAAGELLYVTDDQRLFVGNGTTLGGVQITGYTNENAVDAVGAALAAGVHSGITFTYGITQDLAGRIDATVDLSTFTGTISAAAFKGSVVADDSTILVDAVSGTITAPVIGNVTGNLTGNVTGNVFGNVTGNLTGNADTVTNGVYTTGVQTIGGAKTFTSTIFGNLQGNVTGNVSGNVSGNVTGNLTGNSTGFHTGDMRGSVFGDDSTSLVDGPTGRIIGVVESSSVTGARIKLDSTGISTTDASVINVLNEVQIVGSGESGILKVIASDPAAPGFYVENFNNTAFGGSIVIGRGRGTSTARTRILSGDSAGYLVWLSERTGAADTVAYIDAGADGVTSNGIIPGYLDFYVTDSSGTPNSCLRIDAAGSTAVKRGFKLSGVEDLANAAAADITKATSYFTTAGSETATLAAGSSGDVKIFTAVDVTAGNMVITVTNAGWKASGTGTITFSSRGSSCILQYVNSKWFCIGNNGASFA